MAHNMLYDWVKASNQEIVSHHFRENPQWEMYRGGPQVELHH